VATVTPLEVTGPRKAAILLTALSQDVAAEVLRHLKDDELERVALEISLQHNVNADLLGQVLQEFHQLLVARYFLAKGGIDYAQDLLNRGVGPERAKEVLQRLTAATRPLSNVRVSDPVQLAGFIQNEQPQTIAAIAAHLSAEHAAGILASLPVDWQADVLRRIALLDRTSPEALSDVERVLMRKLSALGQSDFTSGGGLKQAVDVLNHMDSSASKQLMEALSVEDPPLAEEIKKNMFLFNDIVQLDARSLQLVLRQVDVYKDLPVALKMANDSVRTKILGNLSKRTAEILQEAIESLPPVRVRDVEAAQGKIVALIRSLEEKGEIAIGRGQGGDVLV